MGYTKEYMIGFCEFLFALVGVFIIVSHLSSSKPIEDLKKMTSN